MPSRWERCPTETLCGRCGLEIAIGAPVLVITPAEAGRKWKKVRCARRTCAGPAPADLPPLPVQAPSEPVPLERIGKTMMLPMQPAPRPSPFDAKRAAAEPREPGEDG